MSKRPASSPAGPKCPKRKNKTFTLEEKIKILDELNAGAGCSTLGRRYGVNESTIRSIRGNADKFRKAYAQPEIKNSTLHIREPTYKKMEEALKIWIEDMQMRQGFLTGSMIQTQALAIQEHLLVKEGKSASDMKFTASQGWLHNFIKRIGLQHVKLQGEAASSNVEAAEQAKIELQRVIKEAGYTPDQVWNCDETGLVWKKMPEKTYLMKSVGKRPGHKKDKHRVTLLLCANASGMGKMKPLLIHTAARPHSFKKNCMTRLPVHWRFNKKAWMTADIFDEWIATTCIKFIEKYNKDHNLPNKALLLMDNASVHKKKNLKNIHETIKVQFLPANVTPLVQPLDQGVIAVLKRLFLKETLKQMVDAMSANTQLTAPQFWKNFTIKEAVNNIATSWNAIKSDSLNGIWRPIWPEVVNEFQGFECQKKKITQEFIQLGKLVRDDPGFQNLDPDDVEQLVQEMDAPLTVEDTVQLCEEANGCEDDEEVKRKDTDPAIKDWSITALQTLMTSMEETITIIKQNDPDMERVIQRVGALRRVISDYKTLLDRKICEQRQSSIKSYFTSSSG